MTEIPPELRAEQERQELYEWLAMQLQDYKEVFDLADDDLRNKKILEIGATDRRVAATCIISGLTKEVYSLDPAYGAQREGYADIELTKGVVEKLPPDLQKEINKKMVSATAEDTPFSDQSFDLVIGRSVNFDSPEQLARRMKELLRVGNEVRLYPIYKTNRPAYDTALEQVRKELDVHAEFKTTLECDVNTDSGIRHVKEDVLILRNNERN